MKQLTINDLRNELKVALKENNRINNKILVKRIDKVVNDRLSEFSDAILETIDTNRNETNQKFDNLSKDVAGLKQDVKFIHQDVKDIVSDMSVEETHDLTVGVSSHYGLCPLSQNSTFLRTGFCSDKPSRKQFETFKSSFENYPVL